MLHCVDYMLRSVGRGSRMSKDHALNRRHGPPGGASDDSTRPSEPEQAAPTAARPLQPDPASRTIERAIPFNSLTVIVTLLGLLLVGIGYAIRGVAYWADFAQQSGAELILIIPILLVGQTFEARLRKTEESTREMAGSLAAVRVSLEATVARIEAQANASLSEQLRTKRVARVEDFEQALADPQYQAIAGLFAAAYQTKAIHHDGVRIQVPNTELRFRFKYAEEDPESICLQLENQAGSEILASFLWKARESRAQLARRIASGLRTLTTAEAAVADAARADVAAILQSLAQLLYDATAAKTGESAFDLGSVVEIANSQWVIAEEGVRAQGHSARLSVQQLLPSLDQKSVSLLLRKPWVDRDKLLAAIELARMVLAATDGAHPAPGAGMEEFRLQ